MSQILLDTGPSPFGWHRYETFLRCPQLYAWTYHAREAGGDDGRALAMGSLVHVGLGHHYAQMRERQQGRDPDAYYAPVDAVRALTAKNEESAVYRECSPIAQDVVLAYVARYGNERVKVLHVEEVFTLQFGEARMTMRVDLVWEGSDGKVYFVDHKTSGRVTTSHPRWYAMSGQFLAYRWAGRLAFGDRFGGAICNLVQVDPKAISFSRPSLAPVPGMLRKFPAAASELWGRLQRLEAQNLPPSEWPAHPSEHTCWTRYGACPAYARCEWSVSPDANE